MRIELAHTGIEQSCHAPGVLSAVLDFAKRHATSWHVVALSGKIKLLERPQLAGGFQGQWLAEFRTDQSPQIKKSGLVNVRADCLAIFRYPPPTDKFRWCTDRLRIDPVSRFLESEQLSSATVVLGVRESESTTRNLTLAENRTRDRYWKIQRGVRNRRLFLPILDYSVHDVWLVNLLVDRPRTLRAKEVANLYAGASTECPTVRDVHGAPCGKARFGCWTCTVAKNGVTLRNLIAHGEHRLTPLLQYRLWLEAERNNPHNRWQTRRNGKPGLGPMTLEWRRIALKKILATQEESGLHLLHADEISAIHREWEADDAQ